MRPAKFYSPGIVSTCSFENCHASLHSCGVYFSIPVHKSIALICVKSFDITKHQISLLTGGEVLDIVWFLKVMKEARACFREKNRFQALSQCVALNKTI